jgi:hypothetical protein
VNTIIGGGNAVMNSDKNYIFGRNNLVTNWSFTNYFYAPSFPCKNII